MNNSASGDSESGGESSSSTSQQATAAEDKNFIDKILGEMKCQFNIKTEKPSKSGEENSSETVTDDNSSQAEQAEIETSHTDKDNGSVKQEENSEETSEKTEISTNGDAEAPTDDDVPQGDKPSAETKVEANNDEEKEKPRLLLVFKKPNSDSPLKSGKTECGGANSGRRSLRNKSNSSILESPIDESTLKRSARRRSRDYTHESVLQSAIARKEKSYNESNKPQRLTRQLKPTQKILENLALAKQEKTKSEKFVRVKKSNDSDSTNTESEGRNDLVEEGRVKKHKHKHNKHGKKAKRFKANPENCKDSDSDQNEENGKKNVKVEEVTYRRSRRISSTRLKEELSAEIDESNAETSDLYENEMESSVEADLIASRLCLCTKSTHFYARQSKEEATFCGAFDSINGKIIGCSRLVDSSDGMLMRPSTQIPYTPFCKAHKNRLIRHNCCPTCGLFCTQGVFVECENKHQYHRQCQIAVGKVECCPHCGAHTPKYDVEVKMQCAKKPIFLPIQKLHYNSAKMTFSKRFNSETPKPPLTPPLIPLGALDLDTSSDNLDEEEFDIVDLVNAVEINDINKVSTILASKSVDITCKLAESNDGTILHLVAKNDLVAIAHLLIISGLQTDSLDKNQNTPLMIAIIEGKNDMVQYLIKAGASLTLKGTDGMTALHLAAKNGNLRACELLINSAIGATCSFRQFINSCDDGGWTPLVWACEHGYANIANFLIYKGADASIRDNEHNVALHWAAFSGSSHIAELLLNKGCEVNAVNAHGDTPLHIGARQDMYNCIIVLLARGADVTLTNKNNETALDCVPSGGDSYNPISMNITLQATGDYGCPNVILSNDITKGKENNPIQCYNNIDCDQSPADFFYITKSCVTSDDVKINRNINLLQSCNCKEKCMETNCNCGKLSVQCWYDEDGKLISNFNYDDQPMIFECNDRCQCNAITCNNRVVQKGLMHRFELFKTLDKGWGVRTLRPIPKGSFVCEYIGEIITEAEADARDDDCYLFELENGVCKIIEESDGYCIDSKFYGNFARFINHSCNPNLASVKVFVEHQDLRFPRIAFFANRDIDCEEELSFDYGDKFWTAKYKSFSCNCGVLQCRYSEGILENNVIEKSYQSQIVEDS